VVGLDNGQIWSYSFELAVATKIKAVDFPALEPPGSALGYGIGNYGAELYGTSREEAEGVVGQETTLGDWYSFALWGEDLLFVCTTEGSLWRWSPSAAATPAAVVAGAPLNSIGVLVTPERHAILLGCENARRKIKWSSAENLAVWGPLPTNTAGGYTLESDGDIRTGVVHRDGVLILTEHDAHLLRYVGVPYVYSLSRVGDACGPISARSVVAAGPVVAWMGERSFFIWNGQVQPLPCDVGDFLFSSYNPDAAGRVFAVALSNFNEIWWFYSNEQNLECNRYIGWNYAENWWTLGAMRRTAGDRLHSGDPFVLAATDGRLYVHEQGWLADTVTRAGQVYAETGALNIGEGDQMMSVSAIIPDIRGPRNAVRFTFYATNEPDGVERLLGPFYPLTPRNDGRIDVRFACRSLRMRIVAHRDIDWAVGKTRLEIQPRGAR
jgi:hypothetical protein